MSQRRRDLPRGNPRLPGNPRIRPPGLRNPPSTVPTNPTGLPLAIPERMTTCLPRKGGYPRTRGGCYSSLGSSGDISISHSGVSRGHWNETAQATPNHCLQTVSCTISTHRTQPTSEVHNPMCTIATYVAPDPVSPVTSVWAADVQEERDVSDWLSCEGITCQVNKHKITLLKQRSR